MQENKILRFPDNSEIKDFELILIILYYLINAKEVEISDELVTSLNLKGGDLFLQVLMNCLHTNLLKFSKTNQNFFEIWC